MSDGIYLEIGMLNFDPSWGVAVGREASIAMVSVMRWIAMNSLNMFVGWVETFWIMFPATPWFAHTQTTHPNNIIYLSPEDEWKHWLYAVILTLIFQDLGF